MKVPWLVLLLGGSALLPAFAQTPKFVVASLRVYQIAGPSGVHLYFYRPDGVPHQLTGADRLEDVNPRISADGRRVLFTRTAEIPSLEQQAGDYILDLASEQVSRAPPGRESDFQPTLATREFSDIALLSDQGANARVTAKYGIWTLLRRGDAWPFTYAVQSLPAGPVVPLSHFSGYQPSDAGDEDLAASDGDPFLVAPTGYCALFLMRHSYDLWACNVAEKKFYRINPDSSTGDIYAADGEAGFFLVHCAMRQLGATPAQVWCASLEFWNPAFQGTVFGPTLSACYGGAAFYAPGKTFRFLNPKRGS